MKNRQNLNQNCFIQKLDIEIELKHNFEQSIKRLTLNFNEFVDKIEKRFFNTLNKYEEQKEIYFQELKNIILYDRINE